jgi:PleD family two-component response regulator
LTNNDDTQGRPQERSRILVVDDIPANIKTLNAILADDYNVIFATDWRKGLELAEQKSPDIILLDIMMPDMDGYEICQRLKADVATREIPVIFITALDGEADEEKGLAIGAADYITKPFRPAIVRLRVANHLQLKLHRDRLESLTMTDGLTEIANRRRFDQHLDQEWRRCARMQTPLSAIMVDIDYFKAFNDSRHSMITMGIRPAMIASGILLRPSRLYRFGPETSSRALAARNSPACCRGRMVRAQVPSLGACSTR